MKRIPLTVLFLSLCFSLYAQNISLKGFSLRETDFSAMRHDTRRMDKNGEPCALLKIETSESGFRFEGGLLGISDIIYHDAEIWLYVPRGTRKITIMHPRYGVLRDWPFPCPVEGGRTYLLSLETVPPEPVVIQDTIYNTVYVDRYVDRVIERKIRAPRPKSDFSSFSSHFTYTSVGFQCYDGDVCEITTGLGYAYVPGRIGGYASLLYDYDSAMINAGPVVRLSDQHSEMDLQVYAGLGRYGGYCMSVDVGMRAAFKKIAPISMCDVSFGLSYADDMYYPYMSFGFLLSGVVLSISLISYLAM